MTEIKEHRNASDAMHQRETGPAQMEKPGESKPESFDKAQTTKSENSDLRRIAAAEAQAQQVKPRDYPL